jgi:serine/threonine protein kinase
MSVDSAANLVESLRRIRLLAPSQLDEVARDLQHRFRDPRALARVLIERDWLTPYQVNQLLQGAGQDLVLGSYVVLQRIHETFVGTVFKAQHQHMKRLVALTVVRESLLRQAEAVDRFYQEIQAASQLIHPHILCAFDAGPIGRTHFFAMEYVDGIDLGQRVKQSGPLAPDLAATFVRQAAVGLHHAGQRGFLHHDLRPANLLLTHGGGRSERSPAQAETPRPSSQTLADASIKICNLGLTLLQPRARGSFSSDMSMAEAVQNLGTLDYVAPEQLQGAPLADVRSNLYSLGGILYYLLAGNAPFPETQSAVKLLQLQASPPAPLESLRRDAPPALTAVVRKLMALRIEDRFQSPAELAAALATLPGTGPALGDSTTTSLPPGLLNRLAAGQPGAGKQPPPLAPQPTSRGNRWLRRWPVVAAVVAAILIAGGVGAAVLFKKERPAPEKTALSEAPTAPLQQYRKGATREETILRTLKASGLPTLEGKWYYIGPFDNKDRKGFATAYPPEQEIDLAKTYKGKDGRDVVWKELKDFALNKIVNLKLFDNNDWGVVYLYHEMDSSSAAALPISFGSDDTLTVWLNGNKLVSQDVYRGAAPDQARTSLNVLPGKNKLLIKVCQGTGDWAVYVSAPGWPSSLEAAFGASLQRDFPNK